MKKNKSKVLTRVVYMTPDNTLVKKNAHVDSNIQSSAAAGIC